MRKAVLGAKLRRLREQRGLTQAALAQRLGISGSYLNLIEHDGRPVTVPLLLKFGRELEVDLETLSETDERRLALGLREVFTDPALGRSEIDPAEIERLVNASPRAARAILDLHRAFRSAREDAQSLEIGVGGRRIVLPAEEARDFFHDHRNHFAAMEDAAEQMARDFDPDRLPQSLTATLEARGVTVRIADEATMAGAMRRFDTASNTLFLSELLAGPSRSFSLAYHLGISAARPAIDAIIEKAGFASRETATLVRVGLANYFAGAVMMPYARFLEAAQAARYDIERLCRRFAASFEQVCHRLTTLQRPGARGVPFFLVRVDAAGNVSKRFSAAGFHFSRFGGSCPRWIVFDAFRTPGLIRTQIARLPDGATFFSIARAVAQEGGGWRDPAAQIAIALGCDISHARELVYADGLDLGETAHATEIGVGCRLCERQNCRQRAFPPLHHRLVIDEHERGATPYRFQKVAR